MCTKCDNLKADFEKALKEFGIDELNLVVSSSVIADFLFSEVAAICNAPELIVKH